MDTGKLPHGIAVINGILRHGVGQAEPNLKQVHLQHLFNDHRWAATFALGIIRLNDTDPFAPGNDFVHDFQKFFPLGFLLRKLYSISVKVSCFITSTTVLLMRIFYYIGCWLEKAN